MSKIRTSSEAVSEIIAVKTGDNLTGFIKSASLLVDKVATNDTDSLLDTESLADLEKWLAAFYYAIFNQQYMSDNQGKSGATYQTGEKGKGTFDVNDYGRQAMAIDVTGYLAQLNQKSIKGRGKFGFRWFGKTSSEVTT